MPRRGMLPDVAPRGDPLRTLFLAALHLTLRIFFRRIEVRGLEQIGEATRVIFVLNHPNGLVDPLFVLLLSGRRVSFLAKAPLFRMPVIGWMLHAADAIPVYRKQDDAGDTSSNLETFAVARRVLRRGGAIAIFPEGTSHSDPAMKPLKTGAARIALSAVADGEVRIVPAGLYYRAKSLFRSAALVWFGPPILVPARPGGEGGPPADAVRDLTIRIGEAMAKVTLQADRAEALDIVARADRVLAPRGRNLADEVDLRRRLKEGYASLRERSPERVRAVLGRLTRYERELEELGLTATALEPGAYTPVRVTRWTLARLAESLVLLPFALPGLVLHYPAYVLIDRLARSYAGDHTDVLATGKILAGLLLFPLTWIGAALFAQGRGGPEWAIAIGLLAPLTGYTALRFLERAGGFLVAARAFGLYLLGRRRFLRLAGERETLRREIVALGEIVTGDR